MLINREMKTNEMKFSFLQGMIIKREGGIHYIGGNDILPAPLSTDKEGECIKNLIENNDEEAKSMLIEHNLRLVVYIAKKFDNTGVGVEDLISIGTIGLIKGINTFKPDKNIKLATYASRCIENEILMMFRAGKKYSREVSLFEPIGVDKDGESVSLVDVIELETKEVLENLILDQDIRELYEAFSCCLKPQEQSVVKLRYGLFGVKPCTQREIAGQLGISRSYVSRIEKRALKKLGEHLETAQNEIIIT